MPHSDLLDLRFLAVNVPSHLVAVWTKSAEQSVLSLHKMLAQLNDLFAEQDSWWLSSVASRNTAVSPMFHAICCIRFVDELCKTEQIPSRIMVACPELAKALRDVLSNNGASKTEVVLPSYWRVRKLLHSAKSWGQWFLYNVEMWCAGFLFNKNCQMLGADDTPKTIIDTYVVASSLQEDRYYTGIDDYLSKQDMERTFFIANPQGFGPLRTIRTMHLLAKDDARNYLAINAFLKIEDYVDAFRSVRSLSKLVIPDIELLGVNMRQLISTELQSVASFKTAFNAQLYILFFRRLAMTGVNLVTAIDWFENQPFDKAWNIGLKRHFPEVCRRGYMGYFSLPWHLHLYPSESELEHGVLPEELLTIGEALKDDIRRYCPQLSLSVAPAFRFKTLKISDAEKPKGVLVVLTSMADVTKELINLVMDKYNELVKEGYKVYFRAHPLLPRELITKELNYPEEVEWLDGSLDDNLRHCSVAVSVGSSACLEVLFKGVPVIVVTSKKDLTHIPFPQSLKQGYWQIADTGEELVNHVKTLHKYSSEPECIEKKAAYIRQLHEKYVCEADQMSVRQFLRLNNDNNNLGPAVS